MKKAGTVGIRGDERAVTVTVELLLTFSISAILLSLVALSFQSILSSATDIAMYRELGSIGSDIASKIEDLNTMINIASVSGEITGLSSRIEIPAEAGGSPYNIAIEKGLIKLTPEINRYIEVKIPLSPEIPLTNCNISSVDKTKLLKFNRTSGTIGFDQAGNPAADTAPPALAFISPSPANCSAVSQTVTIKVNATDNVQVAKVEYYTNNTLAYTAEYPYEWEWNTERYNASECWIKVIAYDRSGNTAVNNSMVYTVVGLPPGTVTDLMATAQTYPNILLSWTRPATGSVASYKIYRSTEPINDSNKDTNATLIANSWFDSPASHVDSSTAKAPGVKYYYAITAVNSSGFEGSVSNLVNATLYLSGTWNSSDLESSSFTPAVGSPEWTYSFTPFIPNGTAAYEVDVAVTVISYSKSGSNDDLHIEISTLVSDKSTTLSTAKTYWFNSTAYPSNSTPYSLKVYVQPQPNPGKLDSITWNYVEVFVKYSS